MTIEHFKAEGIDITKDLSSIVYVDGVNGDDSNSGDFTSPKKTIGAAVTTVINTHSGSGSIKIAAGTYGETITLEDTTLTSVSISSMNGPNTVSINAFQSTADNENLAVLNLIDLNFSGAFSLSCDVDGGSLCKDGSTIDRVDVDGVTTLKALQGLCLYDCSMAGQVIIENARMDFLRCRTPATTNTHSWVGTNPKPTGVTYTQVEFYDTSTGFWTITGSATDTAWHRMFSGSFAIGNAAFVVNAGGNLELHAGSTLRTNAGTVAATAILALGGGYIGSTTSPYDKRDMSAWTINSGATVNFNILQTDVVSESNVFYVDPSGGHDKFNGSKDYPVATVGAAVTALVGAGGAGRIVVKGGTYAETLTLSSTTLTDVEIVSEGGIAVFNAFSCIADNENLKRLSLENLRFEGAFALKGDTDASDFLTAGQDVVWPASCLNNVTVNAGANDIEFAAGRTIELRGCNFRGTGDFIVENFNFVHMTEGFRVPQAGVGFIIRGVAANPWHNGTKGNTFAYIYAGANAPAGVTTLSNDFGSGTSLFTLYGGARDVSASLITVGDDCRWDVFPYVYTNRDLQVDSGGTARVSPMSHAPNSSGWNVAAGGTLALDAPVQTNPWIDKAFADTGSTLLLGEVVNSTIFCDTSGGGTTLNLPVVDDNHDGLEAQFTVTGGANLIVAGSGGATVMGSPNATVVSGSAQRLKYHHADTDWKFTS